MTKQGEEKAVRRGLTQNKIEQGSLYAFQEHMGLREASSPPASIEGIARNQNLPHKNVTASN
jgi:hypothetical protein